MLFRSPYVIAADVYAEPLHKGRGGWTWYTGSAGWMYQLILESFIGLKLEANTLHFKPCIPEDWPSINIKYTYNTKIYNIELLQVKQGNHFEITLIVDGVKQEGLSFNFKGEHKLTPAYSV